MSAGDQYVWSGPNSGNWGVAANWTDTTTGQDPAPTHPVGNDFVTIPFAGRLNGVPQFQTITGSGVSASLTIQALANLNGTFRTSNLVFSGSVLGGSELEVSGGSLTVDHNVTVGAVGGLLYAVGGTITIGGSTAASLDASNGGSIQVAGLSEHNIGFLADTRSSIEIGTVGGVQAGTAQIDAGAVLRQFGGGAPTVINHGTVIAGGFNAVSLTNTGSISGANFSTFYTGPTPTPLTVTNSGTITLTGNVIEGSLVNNGVLAAGLPTDTNPLANVIRDITGTGQIQIQAGARLATGQASSGQTITFQGTGDTLTIGAASLDSSNFYDATLSGFALNDAFLFQGTVTSASYLSGSGLLVLKDGATTVARLHLAGTYSGDTFRTVVTNGGTVIYIDDGSDTPTPPAGTPTFQNYLWSGPGLAGSWDNAANWTDRTTGATPAPAAPGTHDGVTVNARAGGGAQVITGTGNSASLTIGGDTVLAGTFTTKSLTINNGGDTDLWIESGYALTVNGDASANPGGLHVTGGTLTVTGTLTGALDASGGGIARVGSIAGAGAGLSVDSTSSIEIGTRTTAAAGSLTVDAGATATLYAVHAGAVVNHGTINGGGGATFYTEQVTNTGAITGANFQTDSVDASLSVTNSPTGTITLQDDSIAGAIANGGLLIANKGLSGQGDVVGDVTGTGQIQIVAGAQLTTGAVSAGETITFMGSAGQLTTTNSSLDGFHTYKAKIAGFAPGDVIVIAATATSAVYDSSTGLLHLNNGATNVTNLHLVGDYSGDTFHLTPFSYGATVISITPSGGMSTAAVSASMTSESFDFSGATGGQGTTSDVSGLSSVAAGGITDMSAQLDASQIGAWVDPHAGADGQLPAWTHHAPDFVL